MPTRAASRSRPGPPPLLLPLALLSAVCLAVQSDGLTVLHGAADRGSAGPRVVVVGGGLAGLAATLQAVQEGGPELEVVVIEKETKLGGNSAKASSGISALTADEGDSVQAYMNDTLESGGGRSQPHLVSELVEHSSGAIAFLESYGVDLSKITQLGGHSVKRTHSNHVGPNVGSVVIKALSTAVQEHPQVKIVTGAKVEKLMYKDGKVAGVEYLGPLLSDPEGAVSTHVLEAEAVILTTGGFGANRDMLLQQNPALSDFATTNGPWATGDGVHLGADVGASLVDMDQIQVHPTGFVNPKDPGAGTKFLAPEKLRGAGGLLFNLEGRRFVNELGRRDHVTKHMLQQTARVAWLLLGDEEAEDFGTGPLGFYSGKAGISSKVEGAYAAAEAMGVSAAVLREELENYAKFAGGAEKDPFGKTVFPHGAVNESGTIYIMKVTPVIHYTMGGLAIDRLGRVVGGSEGTIPSLFAAGEVTGGVHGANRLAGNSLLDCTVFGRISGMQAARHALSQDRDEATKLEL